MYYITKSFKLPIGHRLSKLNGKSKCFLMHGHNFKIEVTIKCNNLDENDMVMDFSNLKKIVNELIESWDHGMFLNACDKNLIEDSNCGLHLFPSDPTAEVLCEYLFTKIKNTLFDSGFSHIIVHSVSIWETEDSKAMYMEK